MEIFGNLTLDNLSLDFVLVVLIIAGGFFQKRYLNAWKIDSALKTLLVATIFTFLYLALNCDFASWEHARPCLQTGFVSYAVATSLYEIIVKKLIPKKEA